MNSGIGLSCELQEMAHMIKTVVFVQQTKVELKWNYKYFNINCFFHQPGLVLMKTRSADTKLMGSRAG